MADLKISALTASTTPLAGTEVLPIVQSGATVKVAVSDLTSGRAVSTAALTATGLVTAQKGSANGVTIGDVTTNSNSVLRMQGTSAGYNWQIANNLNSGGIEFTQSTATGGTTYTTPKFEMLNTGNFNVAAGNVVIGTSGKGIDFSATAGTGTSELLADYEEGTWTPTAANMGTITYASYTKVGRQVTCWFNFTAGAGAIADVGGLPFSQALSCSGVVSYTTETVPAVWGILTSGTTFSFRVGSTQQNLSAGKVAIGVLTYFV
jgi:hypothetical protein